MAFKIPPLKEGETLAAWRERLAEHFDLSPKVQEIVRAVSIQSYINGTKDMIEAFNSREEANRKENGLH